ncbi:hypothetical protein LCL89_09260 [Halobacillus yeomjeoni]|uniref:hypothetical protein n=1 Tax=Halobacillus yeomjeoni TaxID=311194 RepID=UPI001CD69288|nr:hypothetical protein [Halobacillus yeomjeoni]MCA0984231.1 hypothetical protein [Halobacillus yeomjeoni]
MDHLRSGGGFLIRIIVSNAALAIVTGISLYLLLDSKITGLVLFISLSIIADYIRKLEKQANIEKKETKKGIISYMITGLIFLLIILM